MYRQKLRYYGEHTSLRKRAIFIMTIVVLLNKRHNLAKN